jgi:hypothetical protein
MNKFYMLYSRTAVPATLGNWWLQEIEVRRVAEDYVGDVFVSTVFLGFDHGHLDRPLLFETMAFTNDEGYESLEEYQERYTTWEEAEIGHARIVEAVRLKLKEAPSVELHPRDSCAFHWDDE